MAELNKYMNKAFEYEEKGFIKEAVQLCSKCIQVFPEYKNEIEFEIAKMNYRNGHEEKALVQFLALYQETENSEIHDLILNAYYGIRQKEFEEHYQENYRLLNNYPHFFGESGLPQIRYYPIFAGKDWIWYYDNKKDIFQNVRRHRIAAEEKWDDVCICSGLLWLEDILLLEKRTRKVKPYMDEENALLLVYQEETWQLLLQLLDLKELIKFDRIVFYDSLKWLEDSFLSGDVMFPGVVMGDLSDEIYEILSEASRKCKLEYTKYQEKALEYYNTNGQEIIRHIKEGKPRILFWTSRYTTALQYHTRDSKEAAERMGLETELNIEKNRISKGCTSNFHRVKQIAEFKPDIIFVIDHFRHEIKFMEELQNLVWVCWVQDPMAEIMNPETKFKLSDRDVILNHYITWKDFREIGYEKKYLIDAPVPSNPYVYKQYCLSEEEKENYSCDICFVCHAGDAEGYIKEVLQGISENIREKIYSIYKGYQEYVYESGNVFYEKEMFEAYIKGALAQHYGIELSVRELGYWVNDMYVEFNQRVFRQALVDWILDAGFTNIKLWGNGWVTEEKYKKYAMGPAKNGETLSKIYQASKIVIGNNVMTTAATRAWETMLSGGFYLSNYIPEENDAVDIRKIIEVDEDVIMFYSREDLIEKLHYYLEHEDERQKMIERGRKAALEKMTYDILMKRVLKEIAKRLEENQSE